MFAFAELLSEEQMKLIKGVKLEPLEESVETEDILIDEIL